LPEAARHAPEYDRATDVLETTRPLFARENAMRVLHVRHIIALAAAVSAAALANAGPAAAATPVDDPSQHGEWTADVQRPAEQYRSRYQLKLSEAGKLLTAVAVTERGSDV
jgi:hypothetical protein